MSSDSKSSMTYLYRHYYDEAALKRFVMDEFVKAMRRNRMTAFLGAMATKEHGYPNWAGLIDLCVETSKKFLKAHNVATTTIEDFEKFCGGLQNELKHNDGFDGRIVASAIGNWIDQKSELANVSERLNAALAHALLQKNEKGEEDKTVIKVDYPKARENKNIIKALIDDLGIRRFITVNYDMEVEYFLEGHTKGSVFDRDKAFTALRDHNYEEPRTRPTQLRISLDDGNILLSDAFQRDRLDRLVEFAVRSSEIDFHVFHLHGRIDKPETMVVSYRDYDRLYREHSPSKLPFEYAQTMLYKANPVLFIGLGMKEAELNKALEELVGNEPYRRGSQTFLLWNAPKERPVSMSCETINADGLTTTLEWEAKKKPRNQELLRLAKPAMSVDEIKANFRLDKLHRLGVFAIFDDELGQIDNSAEPAERVVTAIQNLNKKVEDSKTQRLTKIADEEFRDVRFRRNDSGPAIYTWHFEGPFDERNEPEEILGLDPEDVKERRLWAYTARPGTKKAGAATETVRRWCYHADTNEPILSKNAIFINTSLRLDTDSILDLLCGGLLKFTNLDNKSEIRSGSSREEIFRNKQLFHSDETELLIVFKGLERLFSKSGKPLSAEVDHFFRDYLAAAYEHQRNQCSSKFCNIVVFGTRRMRLYFRELEHQLQEQAKTHLPQYDIKQLLFIDSRDEDPSGYLLYLRKHKDTTPDNDVESNMDDNDVPPPLAGDRGNARDTYADFFKGKRFNNAFESDKSGQQKKLAFAILTVMAFIGQPVEFEALFHAPRITTVLDDFVKLTPDGAPPIISDKQQEMKRAAILKVQDTLTRLKLIHPIGDPYFGDKPKDKPWTRYALHLTLQAEMRERYGVPLSEAVLSTSFNMSLYAAQPADAVVPDRLVHDELGKLIDWMIGAYKDQDVLLEIDACNAGEEIEIRRTKPHVSFCLRAALALIRGFYSTSSLLSLDRGDRILSARNDGALTEHAGRIERLIHAFDETRKARSLARSKLATEDIKDTLGPEPIYADELVWLYNERGVVKLAQGDLYEARFSLNEAERINRTHVEFKDKSHNWRRIWLNQLYVDIERGKLSEAEDRISRIEYSVVRNNGGNSRIDQIRDALSADTLRAEPRLPLDISYEDCLAVALATGYRGLIMNLRGELHSAEAYFCTAIVMLETLDEQRACALFRKYHASLLRVTDTADKATAVAELARAGAESVQQMDIVYGARIECEKLRAKSDKADERRKAMRVFSDALDYATVTDVHRVAVQARKALANLKLANGDFESALDHAFEAMALAGRYGMSLHKLGLRILIGEILYTRNNREAGRKLIESAILLADKVGYQRAIESAQSAIARLDGW